MNAMNVQQAAGITVRYLISQHADQLIKFVHQQFEKDYGVYIAADSDDSAAIAEAVRGITWDLAMTVNAAGITAATNTLRDRAWAAVAGEPMEVDAL